MISQLNYHHLYYFWMVCREKGFLKASQKLRIAQSAISQQVSLLEHFLGEPLFERKSRRVLTLTKAGRVTLQHAESIFQQGQELLHFFQKKKQETILRVGVFGGISKNLQFKVLSPILKEYPMELRLEVGSFLQILEQLLQDELDVILSDLPVVGPSAQFLTQHEIAQEPLCLVQASSHQKKKTPSLKEACQKGLYLPAKKNPITLGILKQLKKNLDTFSICGFIDDSAFLRLLALETQKVVALPKIAIARDLQIRSLHVLHEFEDLQQRYFWIYRQQKRTHPLVTKVVAL